jgi:precorrin-4/cobalt-precorrin-4 C11-methyltransferase
MPLNQEKLLSHPITFVGAGPGHPDLITVAGARALAQAQVLVYAGSLVHPKVVALAPQSCQKFDSASMDLQATHAALLEGWSAGLRVVRLHSGDPSLFGAINEQMNLLDQAGAPYQVIPGVSSFLASAAALATELTQPEVSQTVIITRGAGRTPVPQGQELAALAQHKATLCVFLSMSLLDQVQQDLLPSYGADCPCAVVYHAGWEDQKILRMPLKDLAETVRAAGIGKSAMLVAGWALSKQGPASKLYDAGFTHEYRQARHD